MSSTKFCAPTFSLTSSRRLPHCRSLLRTTLLKTKPISRMPRHRAQATELEKSCQFSSVVTTNLFPSSRRVSTIQIVRPLESIAETQPKLHPAF